MTEQILDMTGKLPYVSNLIHLSYMGDVADRCTKKLLTLEAPPAKLTAAIVAFTTARQGESNKYKLSFESARTKQIHSWDLVRDNRLTGLRYMVMAWLHLADEEKRQAAELVQEVLTRYKVYTDDKLDLETEGIAQLVEELERKATVKVAVKTLGLSEVVTEMKEANLKVRELIGQRQEEYSLRVAQELRTARQETDRTYAALIQLVNALAVTTADEAGYSDYEPFIRVVNELIEHYQQSVIPAKKSSDDSDDKGGDDKGGDDKKDDAPDDKSDDESDDEKKD